MDKLFKKLASTPGVIGAFIYHGDKGMKKKSMPAVFKDENLNRIATSLIKMLSASEKGLSDIRELSMYYEESIVLIREPVDNHFIVVFCDTVSGKNHSKKPVSQVRQYLEDAVNRRKKTKSRPLAAIPKIKPNDKDREALALMNSSPMSKSLQGMEASLSKVMGPVAKVVFINALHNWIETDQPSFDSMPVLVDMLGHEINDNEKFKDYRGGITPYIEKQSA
jgi:hypothetical protein